MIRPSAACALQVVVVFTPMGAPPVSLARCQRGWRICATATRPVGGAIRVAACYQPCAGADAAGGQRVGEAARGLGVTPRGRSFAMPEPDWGTDRSDHLRLGGEALVCLLPGSGRSEKLRVERAIRWTVVGRA